MVPMPSATVYERHELDEYRDPKMLIGSFARSRTANETRAPIVIYRLLTALRLNNPFKSQRKLGPLQRRINDRSTGALGQVDAVNGQGVQNGQFLCRLAQNALLIGPAQTVTNHRPVC
jgi:hypothetical protein